jgi:hypothetical protein
LYDSFSGCLADDLDRDAKGPSLCDASESKEHTVASALSFGLMDFQSDTNLAVNQAKWSAKRPIVQLGT